MSLSPCLIIYRRLVVVVIVIVVAGVSPLQLDGAFHDVDSSTMAFEIAGRACCREGLRKGGGRLMEPLMQVRARIRHGGLGEAWMY